MIGEEFGTHTKLVTVLVRSVGATEGAESGYRTLARTSLFAMDGKAVGS